VIEAQETSQNPGRKRVASVFFHCATMFGSRAFIASLLLATEVSTSPTPTIEKRSERTSAPSGCLTVGTGGTYATFGDALAALGSSINAACIYLASGTYEEQNTINYPGSLTIYGETTYVESYKENTVTITYSQTSSEASDLQASATIQVVTSGVSFYNINVVNGYGAGTQAVA
jgi:pectinesterase